MEDDKKNKSYMPGENKQVQKKIRFKPNRAAEGVVVDANGVASVDAEKAEYLVSIGYAEYVQGES